MKVLIPVDGSEASLETIKTAAQFLDKPSSEIYLLTISVPVATELSWTVVQDEETMLNILSRARQEATKAGFQVMKTEFSTYLDAASAICEYALDIQADLIVMGSHGYQGVAKFLMGSVSEKVFKEAKQPVIVVRNDKSHTVEISQFETIGLQQVVK